MRHDLQLRATARVIYDACYPSEEWTPIGFDQAERFGTVHYRQAVIAAQQARCVMAETGEQSIRARSLSAADRLTSMIECPSP